MADSKVTRVLVSVADKTGIVEFAKSLVEEFGTQVISTGGTAHVLAAAGVPVTPVEDVTHVPELMGGRVKTLHPSIHGGLLAKRDDERHRAEAADCGIDFIDMVVVNLNPFEDIAASGADFDACVESIDIGGSALLRSAAKNHESVVAVADPALYEAVLAELRAHDGATTLAVRRALALDAFRVTGAYDTAVSRWFTDRLYDAEKFPVKMSIQLAKRQDLRYGENPHQAASLYRRATASEHALVNARQLSGKPLSYSNVIDADACWSVVRELNAPGVVIVKHRNPCGSAESADVADAFDRALACDEKGAFGGVVAANCTVTADMVNRLNDSAMFAEVLIAPDFEPEAVELLAQKPNLRVLATGGIDEPGNAPEYVTIDGGVLVQDVDQVREDPAAFTCPTKRQPTKEEMKDLLFAWKVVKGARSNAVLVAKDRVGIGLGAGQSSRVDSCRIACESAGEACKGAVAASDAFFSFSDDIDVLARNGITAVIQPGGSIRDEESVAACDKYGMAMVFTAHRHFRL